MTAVFARPPGRLLLRLPGALALALVIGLSGCGGGGGRAEPEPAPLTFGPVTPARVTVDVPQGAAPPSVELSSQVGGDVNRLVGRTIYVRLLDTAGLYGPTAVVRYDETTRRASLEIAGLVQNVAGERSTRLGIQVCEDLACQRPYTTSALTVDVSVRVTAGMQLAEQAVSVSAPFGSRPSPTLLGVTTPAGTAAQDFRFSLLPPNSGSPDPGFDVSASTDPAQPGVLITPRLLREGRYQTTLMVESTANAGLANVFYYRTEVPLVLEVTPPAADYAVLPAAVAIELAAGDPFVKVFNVATVARQGAFALMAITYDDALNPPASANSPVLGQWLRAESGAFVVGGCINDACLPPGSYHASLRFERFGDDGLTTGLSVTVPVTMTVR
jgi:hypothetical protein